MHPKADSIPSRSGLRGQAAPSGTTVSQAGLALQSGYATRKFPQASIPRTQRHTGGVQDEVSVPRRSV